MELTVDIVTPERLIMQTHADAVIVPAVDGELGIWPAHAPLLAQLRPGQIRLQRDKATELFAVSGGFVEVINNRVTVLAETAELAHEIDAERARHAAEQARVILRSPRSSQELAQAEAALQRALIRLHVAEILRSHSNRSSKSR